MMRMKRRILSLLAVCLLMILTTAFYAYGAKADGDTRVFDMAELFTQSEADDLEQRIAALRKKMNMDVVLVTTDDAEGKSAEDYIEDFYIDGNFGTGKDYNGVIFLIDMDNRELNIAPVGKMNRFLTDDRWNKILDDVYNSVGDGDFYSCGLKYLKDVEKYFDAGIPGGQYNYDRDTGQISVYRSIRGYEAGLALIVAFVTALIACLNVIRSYGMKRERNLAGNFKLAYRADCGYRYRDSRDDLINKTVTHIRRPRNNSSGGGGGRSSGGSSGRSTTRSSSGRSFGGGGRKF